MAGQPKKRAIIAELTKRAREEIGETATPLDYAEQWVSSGNTLVQLARSISAVQGVEIMREQLSRYLNDLDDAAEARLIAARARGGHALAETALTDAENVRPDRESIAKAKLVGDMRWRIAGAWNRAELGEQQRGAAVSITIGNLHLDGLRAMPSIEQEIHNPMRSPRVTAQLIEPVVDAEIEGEQLELDMSPRMPLGDASR